MGVWVGSLHSVWTGGLKKQVSGVSEQPLAGRNFGDMGESSSKWAEPEGLLCHSRQRQRF